jgi:hypothetical protein
LLTRTVIARRLAGVLPDAAGVLGAAVLGGDVTGELTGEVTGADGEALGAVFDPPLLLPQPAMRPLLATAATARPATCNRIRHPAFDIRGP